MHLLKMWLRLDAWTWWWNNLNVIDKSRQHEHRLKKILILCQVKFELVAGATAVTSCLLWLVLTCRTRTIVVGSLDDLSNCSSSSTSSFRRSYQLAFHSDKLLIGHVRTLRIGMQIVVHRNYLKLDASSSGTPRWIAKGNIPDTKTHDTFKGKFRRGPGFSKMTFV